MYSKIGKLVKNDFIRGFFLTVITAVLTLVYQALQNGGVLDWGTITTVGLTAGIGYILKNLASDENNKVVGKF